MKQKLLEIVQDTVPIFLFFFMKSEKEEGGVKKHA